MRKESIQFCYALVFLLAFILYLICVVGFIKAPSREWLAFIVPLLVVSLIVMFLALWGYWIINRYLFKREDTVDISEIELE